MELIVISDTKLKVVLTPEDMALFCLDYEQMEEDCDPARGALENLFREVKRVSGFDAMGSRVLVQVWRDRSGGCELYVTKLSSKEDADGKGERAMHRTRCLYSFEDFECLTTACRVLTSRAYRRPSDAYRGEDGRWYLVLEGSDIEEEVGPLTVLNEYGCRHPMTTLTLLSEHGTLVSRGTAVSTLASLA